MTVQPPARKSAAVRVRRADRSGGAERAHDYRTVEERVARGQAWRDAAPIEGHATYAINRRRKDPVGILRAQDDARVQDLGDSRHPQASPGEAGHALGLRSPIPSY